MRYVPPIDFHNLPTISEVEASLKENPRILISKVRPEMDAACLEFEREMASGLHTLAPIGLPKGVRKALETAFARRSGVVRTLIATLTEHFENSDVSTCPYCNFGEQWETDHYLPKSIFPEFALFHANLIPICKPCNGKKRTRYCHNGDRLFIHAFSELEHATDFLSASIVYDPEPRLQYSLSDPGTLGEGVFDVLQRHFDALALGCRYERQASTTLAQLIRNLRKVNILRLGREHVQMRLTRMAEDRSIQCAPNHWEVELLRTLAATTDFTDYVFDRLAARG